MAMLAAADLLDRIITYCRQSRMAETTFGRRAVNDGKLVARLRNGRSVSLDTAARVEAFIADHPANGAGNGAPAPALTLSPRPAMDLPPEQNFRFFDNRHVFGTPGHGEARLGATPVELGGAGDVLSGDAPGDAGEADRPALFGDVEAEAQGDARRAWRRFEADERECRARILAHDCALARKRQSGRLHRSLADEGNLDRRGFERGLARHLGIRHARDFHDQSALAPLGRRDPLERQIGKEQDQHRLRLFARDHAVDIDPCLAELGGVAGRAR